MPDDAAPLRPLVAFLGGAGDRLFQPCRSVFRRVEAMPEAAGCELLYAAHWQAGRVLDRIAARPAGAPVHLVGHSWGGDAAARLAARLGAEGRQVALLLTIDPVARWIDPVFLARVRAGARVWVNARAVGGPHFHYSDVVAAIGGPYGEAPRRFADLHLDLPQPPAAFGAMLAARLPDGRSLLDLALHGPALPEPGAGDLVPA